MGITSGTAARILGISIKTLTAWSDRGLLHPVRAPSGWRYFNQKEVEALANARSASATKEA